MLQLNNMADRFDAIYKGNIWLSEQSVSGNGSTLKSTENLRKELPKLVDKYGAKSILDAPCGDLNWMQHVLAVMPEVKYLGADIVDSLIEKNTRQFARDGVSFAVLDITKDALPDADIMILRDCLMHLCNRDIRSVIRNFCDSGVSYLFLTNFVFGSEHKNADIISGDYRPISIFSYPFCCDQHPLETINDYAVDGVMKTMNLYSAAQMREANSRAIAHEAETSKV